MNHPIFKKQTKVKVTHHMLKIWLLLSPDVLYDWSYKCELYFKIFLLEVIVTFKVIIIIIIIINPHGSSIVLRPWGLIE